MSLSSSADEDLRCMRPKEMSFSFQIHSRVSTQIRVDRLEGKERMLHYRIRSWLGT